MRTYRASRGLSPSRSERLQSAFGPDTEATSFQAIASLEMLIARPFVLAPFPSLRLAIAMPVTCRALPRSIWTQGRSSSAV